MTDWRPLRPKMTSEKKIQEAVAHAALALGYPSLREKQVEVVESFVRGNDVFGVLPTGYGKSLCYGCLPATFDYLSPGKDASIVVVVSPLVAIMTDQVMNTEVAT